MARWCVLILFAIVVLVAGTIRFSITTTPGNTTPQPRMTTPTPADPNQLAPGEHASATLSVGQSVAASSVTVTFLTPFVQTPAYYEGDPRDLQWWQFRVTTTDGSDALTFSLNHQYPEIRFHDLLIHLDRGTPAQASIVLRPLPPRPVPILEGDAAARALRAVLETEPNFPEPVADERVLEDRVWEIRVTPMTVRRAHYEVRIDALTGAVLGIEAGGGS